MELEKLTTQGNKRKYSMKLWLYMLANPMSVNEVNSYNIVRHIF